MADLKSPEAFLQAAKIAEGAGQPVNAQSILAAAHSKAMGSRGDFFSDPAQLSAPVISPQPTSQDISASINPSYDARNQLLAELSQIGQEAAMIGDMNKKMVKTRLLRELDPTSEIDERINQLQREANATQAVLDEKYKDLPPWMRLQLVDSKMKTFGNDIDHLLTIRDTRLKQVDQMVDDEITETKDTYDAMNLKLNVLKQAATLLNQATGDTKAFLSLQADIDKTVADKNRAAKKATRGGYAAVLTDNEKLVNEVLLKQGRTVSKAQLKQITETVMPSNMSPTQKYVEDKLSGLQKKSPAVLLQPGDLTKLLNSSPEL